MIIEENVINYALQTLRERFIKDDSWNWYFDDQGVKNTICGHAEDHCIPQLLEKISDNQQYAVPYPELKKLCTTMHFAPSVARRPYCHSLDFRTEVYRVLMNIYERDQKGSQLCISDSDFLLCLAGCANSVNYGRNNNERLARELFSILKQHTTPEVTSSAGLGVAAWLYWDFGDDNYRLTIRSQIFQEKAEKEANKDKERAAAELQSKSQQAGYANGGKSGGCYVATAVYGSYDCPQVWTLRRFRDGTLSGSVLGRAFIRTYYLISPTLVKYFGQSNWFMKPSKLAVDALVNHLQKRGVSSEKYND